MTRSDTRLLRIPLHLPLDRARAILAGWDAPAFLEGGPGLGPAGRWSILAARPRRTIESRTGRGFVWSGGSLDLDSDRDALEGLGLIAAHHRLARSEAGPEPEPGGPPFRGGLIGHLGYDLAPLIERIPRRLADEPTMPALRFGLYDTFLAVDHRDGRVEIRGVDLLDEGDDAVLGRLEAWVADLDRSEPRPPGPAGRPTLRPDRTRADYEAGVDRVLEYIRAGNIFQANLSQRFRTDGPIDPFALYQALRTISPAPYAAYLGWGDRAIVSASPELFYQVEGDRIRTRPIKGTRPRSARPERDAELAAELLASPKDRAELTMIVDLERNDLGRICRFGTVEVTNPGSIESFEQVHHLVATVEGRLRPDSGPVEVIRAMFPGGSITGAPKIRAMEIIDEIEPNLRGVYTGAIGYLGRGGRSAFNIAIRTIQVEPGRASYQVGGGIVADSDPALEYEETLHKGRGLHRAILEAGGGG